MCGIAGILRTWQPGEAPPDPRDAIPEAWLDILDDSIKHRGPDGQGRFRQRTTRPDGTTIDVALVHRRLSIIDHADGHQPMVIGGSVSGASSEGPPSIAADGAEYRFCVDRQCDACRWGVAAVTFNGCIYNHRDLREELKVLGHEFHTDHSDTEVLLHGWCEWGNDLFDRLDSMHAVAIWDADLCQLVLSRDRFGEKPLYIASSDDHGLFVFASSAIAVELTISSMFDSGPAVQASDAIEWIQMGYAAETTPFVGTVQIAPGCTMALATNTTGSIESIVLSQFLPMAANPGVVARARRSMPSLGPSRKVQDRVDETIMRAVTDRLEADVPLGCLLSGGVDSSLIATMATRKIEQLTTICVRMPDLRYDESRYAQIVADHIGSRHIVVDADPNPAEDLELLVQTLGLPFGDSSLLPTYWACRAAARDLKVLLSGDGGDELFLGYERYNSVKHTELVSLLAPVPLIPVLLARLLPRQNPKSKLDKLARFLWAGSRGQDTAYREILAIFQRPDLDRLVSVLRRGGHGTAESIEDAPQARGYDLRHHFPGNMLRKTDTASMLAGVELRAPLLDRRLSAVALDLSLDQLMPRGQRKGLLRALARRHLPAEIVDRPKMGFAIPIGEWFRTDYGGMRQLLYDHLESTDPFPGLADAGVEINPDFVRRMLREHDAAGERSINPWHGRDHSQRLYMLVVLSIWCKWLGSITEPRA